MIAFGAVAVGFVTGLWFFQAKSGNSSDSFKFIVGAMFVVMATAVQYDTHVFNRLVNKITKIDAIGLSVELGSQPNAGGTDNLRRNQADAIDDNRARWQGGARLDYIILSLLRLGDRQLRDEQLARMFAEVTPPNWKDIPATDLALLDPPMSDATIEYVRYSCGRISQIAGEIYATQKELRDKVIVSPDVESLINHLRIFYFRALKGGEVPTADIETDLSGLESRLIDEDQAADVKPVPPAENSLCAAWSKAPLRAIPKAQLSDATDFQALGYIALTLALLEDATGDDEGAVQLLDREIRRQKLQFEVEKKDLDPPERDCPTVNVSAIAVGLPAPAPGDCESERKSVGTKQLTAYRRLILIARLEDTEDGMMDSWPTPEIIPIRLRTLQRLVNDFSLAFKMISPKETESFNLFRRAPAGCATTAKLLARWSLVRVVGMANAIESAAQAPEVLHEDESLRTTLDGYAGYVADFDIGCVRSNGFARLSPSIAQHFYKVVGKYWEVRANLISHDDEDDSGLNRPKLMAFCTSRDAYTRAMDMFKDSREHRESGEADDVFEEPDDLDKLTLDQMAGILHDEIDRHTVRDALKRVKGALTSDFPLADVEKFCPQ